MESVEESESGECEKGRWSNRAPRMNLEAVFGLRSVFCLWIVRAHISHKCLSAQKDVEAIGSDHSHYWRVTVFALIAGKPNKP